MEIDWIGIISLITTLSGLVLTIRTFCESKRTKNAVLSYKTMTEYENYKRVIIPKLETICGEITQGRNKPEFRSELIAMIGQMEGYKDYHNSTTKTAIVELETILGINKKPDIDISLSIKILTSTIQMQEIPARAKVDDQPLADILSKLIGGLKQPSPKLFD